jgi:hypothetical protein
LRRKLEESIFKESATAQHAGRRRRILLERMRVVVITTRYGLEA